MCRSLRILLTYNMLVSPRWLLFLLLHPQYVISLATLPHTSRLKKYLKRKRVKASQQRYALCSVTPSAELKSIQSESLITPPSALHCCVMFDIFSHSDPFCFPRLQMCDVIAVWGDCFSARSLISLAVIASEVREVSSTYCTGCRKPSVRFHIM